MSDITSGKTHYANNGYGAPANMADDSLATYCQQMTYVAVDMGSAKNIYRLRVAVHNSTALSTAQSDEPWFQGSNDSTNGSDGTWTNIVQLVSAKWSTPASYPGWSVNETFTLSTKYQWYRINGLTNSTSTVLNEWEMHEAPSNVVWSDTDVTLESNTIGQEHPSYLGSGFDDVLNDGNSTGSWYAYWSGAYRNTGWIGQDFGSGNTYQIQRYKIYMAQVAYAPKTWTFEASDTGSWSGEEVVLDTITNYYWTGSYKWHEFKFINDTAYRYYRIDVTANHGDGTYVLFREMEMNEITPLYMFSGYVYEETDSNPVSRVIYCYRRDTGALMNSTTSASGTGYYSISTTYSGSHFLVALDDESGTQYNLAALDFMTPTTGSG